MVKITKLRNIKNIDKYYIEYIILNILN